MVFSRYPSPVGVLTLTADETGLTGVRFPGRKNTEELRRTGTEDENAPVLKQAARWLDIYFSGQEPDFTPPLHLTGTPFRLSVWELLLHIGYGETTTYGALAAQIAEQRGMLRMSARAVGGAVGSNPVAIIVPCHRVLGADGSLTGFGGGLRRKLKLLELEGHNSSEFYTGTYTISPLSGTTGG
ncbi:MAG: methylated-DNA--[protein]-cysteine S-methyltransferase [Oscillospiraceae bacterium]|nr:methylated-DNA--[protein]-cysteine S-methyltransferase [Oscillospiraceae bacterium]